MKMDAVEKTEKRLDMQAKITKLKQAFERFFRFVCLTTVIAKVDLYC